MTQRVSDERVAELSKSAIKLFVTHEEAWALIREVPNLAADLQEARAEMARLNGKLDSVASYVATADNCPAPDHYLAGWNDARKDIREIIER